jgi:hypothetical protein
MSRTLGARDLSKRKRRSDRNKRRKFYAKKPVKQKRHVNGKLIPYKSKRGANDPISIWFQKIKKMSYEGYMKWTPKMRSHLDRTAKPFVDKPVKVNPEEIATPEKLSETAIHILKDTGVFNLMMPSASKSSWRVSYKKKAVIKITETEEGLHATVVKYSKMRHYSWFWKG